MVTGFDGDEYAGRRAKREGAPGWKAPDAIPQKTAPEPLP